MGPLGMGFYSISVGVGSFPGGGGVDGKVEKLEGDVLCLWVRGPHGRSGIGVYCQAQFTHFPGHSVGRSEPRFQFRCGVDRLLWTAQHRNDEERQWKDSPIHGITSLSWLAENEVISEVAVSVRSRHCHAEYVAQILRGFLPVAVYPNWKQENWVLRPWAYYQG